MRRVLSTALLLLVVASCSGAEVSPLCGGRVSVAEYVLQFEQGLANFDDAASLSLEANSVSVLDVLLAARESAEPSKAAAESLASRVATFIATMNSHDWVVSQALDDDRSVSAADALSTEESLRQANTVEALVLSSCPGVSTLAAPSATYDTLPAPSTPSPTATDPPDAGQKEESEARVLGELVGNTFGITMSPAQVMCVGRALADVVDATQAQSGPGQYVQQYQTAFDDCDVDFMVPAS